MKALIAALLLAIPLARLAAQEDEDHDHHHLHLSHPLVTESPSPDTKIRLDYMHSLSSEAASESETEWRVEGEYAFVDALSLTVVAPYIVRTESDGTRVSSLGSVELSLKAASLRFGENGILVGGGLSAALPTGSDTKGLDRERSGNLSLCNSSSRVLRIAGKNPKD